MKRLMYVSTAKPGLTEEELAHLVADASEKNHRQHVTGALAFNGINFAQVLEGPDEEVAEIYMAIQQDARHSGVILVSEKAIAERFYPNWGMRRVEGLAFDELVEAMNS